MTQQTSSSSKIVIIYESGSEAERDLYSIEQTINKLLYRYLSILDVENEDMLYVRLFNSREDMHRARGKSSNHCNTITKEAFYIYGNGVYGPFGHELVHLISTSIFDKITERNKALFEGLAMGLAPTKPMVNRLRCLFDNRGAEPLAQVFDLLYKTSPEPDEQIILAFAVKFLISKFGIDKFKLFVSGTPFHDVYPAGDASMVDMFSIYVQQIIKKVSGYEKNSLGDSSVS